MGMIKTACVLATFALATGYTITTVAYSEQDCTGTSGNVLEVENPYYLPGSIVRS